jgi:mxaC protein
LYWIFLRTARSPGIFEALDEAGKKDPQSRPERYLHEFFQTLETPYKAYEAESPEALARAIADIEHLENLPLRYTEIIPKKDLSPWCYGVAWLAVGLLLASKFAEVSIGGAGAKQ